jgi:hypothetical protein
MVSYKGYTNINYRYKDAPIGALISRVQSGKYFIVRDGMTYVSPVSGPLYFFANNSNYSVQPNGLLDLFVYNVKIKSIDEIEANLGWNIKELTTTDGHDYLSPQEKLQYIFINKMRTNPKLFANQYLIHLIENGSSYKEVYDKLVFSSPFKMLKPNKSLYLAAFDHAVDLGENGSTGHLSTNGNDLRTRLAKYSLNPTYFGENCSYGIKDPLNIIIQLLVDDGNQSRSNRSNLLNEGYNQVGISFHPHISYKWNCVQVFGCNIVQRNINNISEK